MRSIFKLEKLITNRREKLQAPDFLRSRRRGRRLRRRGRVRLHRVGGGGCGRRPGVDYFDFEAMQDRPAADRYDDFCHVCWRGANRPDGDAVSSDSSGSTSSGSSSE